MDWKVFPCSYCVVEIIIGENFDFIYVGLDLDQFVFTEFNGIWCLMMSEGEFDYLYLYGNYDTFKKDSLLLKVGRYFANLKRKCPKCLRSMYNEFQSEPTELKKENR